MRNHAAFGKRVRRAFVCSLIAVVIFLCGNIWVSRAEYVDPGFVPCVKGFLKCPGDMCYNGYLYYE